MTINYRAFAVVVLAALGACQNDRQITGTTQADAVATTAAWPNEPAGFTPLTDYAFNDAIGTGSVVLSGGWEAYNPQGGVTQLTNRTDAPASPPNVGQWSYPVGFAAGGSPGTMFFDHAPLKEAYAAFWWEPSNPWQGHAEGENDIAYWITQNNSIFVMRMLGSGSGPFKTQFLIELASGAATNYDENVASSSPLALGQWHRVEFYIKYATSGSNGIVKWWVDGVLLGSYTTAQTPNDAGVVEFQFSPIWGGTGGTKTEQDYFWYDQVHLSYNAAPPNSPPVVNAGPNETAITGLLYTLNFSFSDPDNNGPWSYLIDWGDSTSTSGTANAQGTVSQGHTYVTMLPRTYTVTVTVKDNQGASGSGSKSVSVLLL